MSRSEKDIITDIDNVYCDLSPENLTCDGELPAYLTREKLMGLKTKLKKLFRELGREVNETEAMRYLGKF
jgi:hypothetical protein